MSYQPLYSTIWDNASPAIGHTSSRSGRVTRVSGDVNSVFGEVLTFDVSTDGELDKKDSFRCSEKMEEWKEKGNTKKVQAWQMKKLDCDEYNFLQEQKERVDINFRPKWNKKFHFNIDGVNIDEKNLRILQLIQQERWKELFQVLEKNKGCNVLDLAVASEV